MHFMFGSLHGACYIQTVVMRLLIATLMVCAIHGNWVDEMWNPGLFEGDILLNPQQRREIETGRFEFASVKHKLWPNAVIPYEISGELTWERKAMKELDEAIKQYHTYTCLRFKRRTTEKGYIEFYKGGGCSSPVGYSGRRNGVSLSSGCWWRATIMHEIGHSLGFFHEQSRPDRDNYVKILFHNIASRFAYNFKKQNYSDIDSKGTPYDYRSMMHYRYNAFGKDLKMTIKTLDPSKQYEIGQDGGFSHIDIKQINQLYNCKGTYPTLPPYISPPPGCVETGPSCHQDKHEGLCTKKYFISYMRKKCPRVCGYCDVTKTTTTTAVKTSTTSTTPTAPTAPTASTASTAITTSTVTTRRGSTGGASCADVIVNCKQLGLHHCAQPHWMEFMKKRCKKSCNFC